MTQIDLYAKLAPYWTRFGKEQVDRLPPGADLAALRRGVGRPPMEAPQLWPFYTRLNDDGRVSAGLRAEHVALGLFAVHQQSMTRLMHWPSVGVGDALRALRASGRYSERATDRRVSQAATAASLEELAHHLRALITMLKTLESPQGLDYTRLTRDLIRWQDSETIGRVRREWGSQYFRPTQPKEN